MSDIERLLCCALIRDGITHKGFSTHSDLRGSLGDEDAYKEKRGDIYGFWTTAERFVGRGQAAVIAFNCGQARQIVYSLLSSEVTWDAKPKTAKKQKRKLYGKQPKRLFRA